MIKKFKRIILLLFLGGFLFAVTGCDFVFEEEEPKIEFVNVSFNYQIDNLEPFTFKIKKDEKLIEPKVPKRNDHIFMGWFNGETLYDFNLNISENLNLNANWLLNEGGEDKENYLISFNYNIDGLLPSMIKVEEGGKSFEPITPHNEGYEFLGWFVNVTDDSPFNFDTPINSNLSLNAKWDLKEPVVVIEYVDVNYVFNNTNSSLGITIVKGNKAIEPKTPIKAGHSFAGWFTDEGLKNAFNFQQSVLEDLTLYAKWTVKVEVPDESEDVLITYNYNMPSVEDISVKVEKGERVVEARPLEHLGSSFVGWFIEGHLNPFDFSTKLYEDITLNAKWEPTPIVREYVDVTYISDGDELLIETVTVEKQSIFTPINNPTKEYHTFIGWFEQGEITPFDFLAPLTENVVLIAKFSINEGMVSITLLYDGKEELKTINRGSKFESPKVDVGDNNILLGWLNPDGDFFNFEEKLYEDIVLTAYIYPTMESQINHISQNVMRGNVKIYKTLYRDKVNDRGVGAFSSSIGSGSIIKKHNNFYFILTNAHVVSRTYEGENGEELTARFADYKITDYLEREYMAIIVDSVAHVNEDYDLAILRFTTENEGLEVIPIGESFDPEMPLVLVGQPHGQRNTITIGMFERNVDIKMNDKTYNANKILVPGAAGSSGSMMIDFNYNLVGVVFAGQSDTPFLESTYMFVVTLERVKDFLDPFFDSFVEPVILYNNQIYVEYLFI